MNNFIPQLKKKVDAKIEQIERSEISMIAKSLEASDVLADAFNQLKEFTLLSTFVVQIIYRMLENDYFSSYCLQPKDK